MEKTVKVSVIMLAYNIENYIEIAIKGVLSQKTDYPVELIIGEDRSTDRTYEICKRYQEKYPELITVIRHEKNLGYQRNYMETYKHCRGEYVAVCDGDDYWFDRRKLQRATDFLDTHSQFAICFHRVVNYYEEDGSKSLSNGHQRKITTISDLAESNYITNSSSVFRRCYYPEMPEWFAKFTSCDYALHLLNAQHGRIPQTQQRDMERNRHGQETGHRTYHQRVPFGLLQRQTYGCIQRTTAGTCQYMPESHPLLYQFRTTATNRGSGTAPAEIPAAMDVERCETAGDITPPANRKENKSANRENADMGKRNRFTIHTASPRQHRDMTYIFRL